MSTWQSVKRWWERARSGAGGLAESASLRLDVRGLEGRRNHLLRAIGMNAVEMHRAGRGVPEFTGTCREIEEVDRAIAEKRAELGTRKGPSEQTASTA